MKCLPLKMASQLPCHWNLGILARNLHFAQRNISICAQPTHLASGCQKSNGYSTESSGSRDGTTERKTSGKTKRRSGSVPTTMSCWQAYSYGSLEVLRLSHTAQVPVLRGPRDVLVNVHASSVNPFDVKMLGVYAYDDELVNIPFV